MKSNYDVIIIGSGLTARFAFEGIMANSQAILDLCFLQVKNTATPHHSVVLEHGGMAQYWHKGLMSPGLEYFKQKGIDERLLNEFDNKYCPEIDHEKTVMHISPLAISSFISPADITKEIDSIISISEDDSGVSLKVRVSGQVKEINTKKLVVAASSFGCLDILSIIRDEKLNCNVNDHTMHISKDDEKITISPLWKEFSTGIRERRLTLMFPEGVYLSPRVDLLVKPYIGRILYGLRVPKLALEAVLKKIFEPKLFYTFTLETPKEDVYSYSTGSIEKNKDIVSAFHSVGEYPVPMDGTSYSENMQFISGLNLGRGFKVFPSYTMALIAYKIGKELKI